MHDVAWRGMWISVRSKDAQKQLARTSLSTLGTRGKLEDLWHPEYRFREKENLFYYRA